MNLSYVVLALVCVLRTQRLAQPSRRARRCVRSKHTFASQETLLFGWDLLCTRFLLTKGGAVKHLN